MVSAFAIVIIFTDIIIVAVCGAEHRKTIQLTAEHRHFATSTGLGTFAAEVGKKLGLAWPRDPIALHAQISRCRSMFKWKFSAIGPAASTGQAPLKIRPGSLGTAAVGRLLSVQMQSNASDMRRTTRGTKEIPRLQTRFLDFHS